MLHTSEGNLNPFERWNLLACRQVAPAGEQYLSLFPVFFRHVCGIFSVHHGQMDIFNFIFDIFLLSFAKVNRAQHFQRFFLTHLYINPLWI